MHTNTLHIDWGKKYMTDKVFWSRQQKRKNKPTFCHSDINSSFYLTKAPQYILHEVFKSCQGNMQKEDKMQPLLYVACPYLNKHKHI